MYKTLLILISCFSFTICSCQDPETSQGDTGIQEEIMMEDEEMDSVIADKESQAVITAVQVSGSENNYTFNVTIKSPDTGCKQYADWWEVFDEEGKLLYRRILGHSHVDEQPFTRSGGPVAISENQVVYVRAHMNPIGYGSFVYYGSIKDGFKEETIGTSVASDLETTAPLPTDCAF